MGEFAVVEVEVGAEARFFVRTSRLDEGALILRAVDEAALFVIVQGGLDRVSFVEDILLEGCL